MHMIPTLQMSVFESCVAPSSTSGDMKSGVPTTVFALLLIIVPICDETPKSAASDVSERNDGQAGGSYRFLAPCSQ